MKKTRFKQFLRERNQFSVSGNETLLSVSEYYGVKPRAEAFEGEEFESRASTLEGYRVVKENDLVMNYMLAWKGAYGISKHDGIVSPAYSVFEVDRSKVDVRYLHHRVRSDEIKAYFRSRSKGIIESRLRLYPDSLLASFVSIPDLSTQREIADFLDRETARIDLLIEKKQKLVALLGERNQVARSDNMKRLRTTYGERKLSHVCVIQRGRFNHRPRNAEELYGGEFPFIQTGDVAQSKKFISKYTQTLSELGASISKKFSTNTVLMAIAANVGNVAILNFDAYCPDSVVGFLPSKSLSAEFLYYVLKDASKEIATASTSNAQDNTNIARLSAIRVPFPPMHKQISVAAHFAAQEEYQIRFSKKSIISVDRLKEYRSALITAAVTGQIDVTTYAKSGTNDRRLDAIQEEMGA